MKNNTEKLLVELKNKYYNFTRSVYCICFICVLVSGACITFICNSGSICQQAKDISLSIFTGIIASVAVTAIIQIKQDHDNFQKKKAILFELGFILSTFFCKISKHFTEHGIDYQKSWKEIYFVCHPAACYISELYQNNPNIFDDVEINIIREIIKSFKYIEELMSVVNEQKDNPGFLSDEKDIASFEEAIIKQVRKLQENLCCLTIKLREDKTVYIATDMYEEKTDEK